MYSHDARIRAVELYIKLGKRVAATIHQLGYPTKSALKSWHQTYELGSGLPRAYVRAKPKYSQALNTFHYRRDDCGKFLRSADQAPIRMKALARSERRSST